MIEREQINGIDLFRYEIDAEAAECGESGHAYRIRRSLAQLRVNGEASFPSVKLEACHIWRNSLDFKATTLAAATTLYRLRLPMTARSGRKVRFRLQIPTTTAGYRSAFISMQRD